MHVTQSEKAKRLLELHDGPELLILPNVWDPLGARVLAGLGFPAVATASAAVAFSLGYDDGERISFAVMREAVHRIAGAVDVPVSADLERGYATTPAGVAAHVREILEVGAVGVNLEDSLIEGGELRPVAAQCDILRAVRQAGEDFGVHLVINARTDVFLRQGGTPPPARVQEAISRACAYREAGADCIYPIGLSDLSALMQLREATGAPLNVFASDATPSIATLKAAGIARLSLGPGLLRACTTTLKRVADQLLAGGSYDIFTRDVLTSDDIRKFLSLERMPED